MPPADARDAAAVAADAALPAAEGGEPAYATVSPLHVMLVGAGALGSGALITASISYKRAEKQLAAEGIDPRVRRIILPHAISALAASLFATGCVAAAGLYALRSVGLVVTDSAAVPAPREAFRLMAWGDTRGLKAAGAAAAGVSTGSSGSGAAQPVGQPSLLQHQQQQAAQEQQQRHHHQQPSSQQQHGVAKQPGLLRGWWR